MFLTAYAGGIVIGAAGRYVVVVDENGTHAVEHDAGAVVRALNASATADGPVVPGLVARVIAVLEDKRTISLAVTRTGGAGAPLSVRVVSEGRTTKKGSCVIRSQLPNGEHVVIIGERGGDVVAVPDLEVGSKQRRLLGHTATIITAVAAPADGRYLASCDRDEKIRVSSFPHTWHIQSVCVGHTRFVSSAAAVNAAALSGAAAGGYAPGELLLSGGGDGTLRLWHAATGTLLSTLYLRAAHPLPLPSYHDIRKHLPRVRAALDQAGRVAEGSEGEGQPGAAKRQRLADGSAAPSSASSNAAAGSEQAVPAGGVAPFYHPTSGVLLGYASSGPHLDAGMNEGGGQDDEGKEEGGAKKEAEGAAAAEAEAEEGEEAAEAGEDEEGSVAAAAAAAAAGSSSGGAGSELPSITPIPRAFQGNFKTVVPGSLQQYQRHGAVMCPGPLVELPPAAGSGAPLFATFVDGERGLRVVTIEPVFPATALPVSDGHDSYVHPGGALPAGYLPGATLRLAAFVPLDFAPTSLAVAPSAGSAESATLLVGGLIPLTAGHVAGVGAGAGGSTLGVQPVALNLASLAGAAGVHADARLTASVGALNLAFAKARGGSSATAGAGAAAGAAGAAGPSLTLLASDALAEVNKPVAYNSTHYKELAIELNGALPEGAVADPGFSVHTAVAEGGVALAALDAPGLAPGLHPAHAHEALTAHITSLANRLTRAVHASLPMTFIDDYDKMSDRSTTAEAAHAAAAAGVAGAAAVAAAAAEKDARFMIDA